MSKDDKKPQYFVPFPGFRLAGPPVSGDPSKKASNLSNMKSQLQNNLSSEKNKSRLGSAALRKKEGTEPERVEVSNIHSKLKKLIGNTRLGADAKAIEKISALNAPKREPSTALVDSAKKDKKEKSLARKKNRRSSLT